MGSAVQGLIEREYQDRCELAAVIDSSTTSLDSLANTDVVIDFSLPAGTAKLITWFADHTDRLPHLVCGTTGLADAQLAELRALGQHRRVLHANNFSTGVAAFTTLLEFAGPLLRTLGYTPVITEAHHRGKQDAPSGTAKALQAVIDPEAPDTVRTHSLRAGTVIGEHEIRFLGTDDEISLRHVAQNRALFARGALDAALWLAADGEMGFLSMRDYFIARFQTARQR